MSNVAKVVGRLEKKTKTNIISKFSTGCHFTPHDSFCMSFVCIVCEALLKRILFLTLVS